MALVLGDLPDGLEICLRVQCPHPNNASDRTSAYTKSEALKQGVSGLVLLSFFSVNVWSQSPGPRVSVGSWSEL